MQLVAIDWIIVAVSIVVSFALVTDFLQFGIAMGGSFVAAVYALRRPEVRRAAGGLAPSDDLRLAFIGWLCGCAGIYAVLFGTGHFLMGNTTSGVIALVIAAASGAGPVRVLPRLWSA